jgi:hypothetical protein
MDKNRGHYKHYNMTGLEAVQTSVTWSFMWGVLMTATVTVNIVEYIGHN